MGICSYRMMNDCQNTIFLAHAVLKQPPIFMPTIDDIPMDSHNEYAKHVQQQTTGPIQYKEDRWVAGPAQADVTAPSYPSQINAFTGEDLCNLPYSAFSPPPESTQKRTSCFSPNGLIPSLGSQESLMALQEKLNTLGNQKG